MRGRIQKWSRRWIGLAIIPALFLSGCGLGPPVRAGSSAAARPSDAPAPAGCTVLTISQGDRVFFGGNSDWHNSDNATYWVDPGGATGYGAVYIGPPHNVQQGFNEMGLAYDSNGLPLAPVRSRPGREPVSATYAGYIIEILRACATVEEVIAWVGRHQWHTAMHDQLHFADATGDAVVISAGPGGEIALTRKPAGDGFLVSTNFNLANPANGVYPCWRHSRAEALLGEIAGPADLTAERVASVLDAVHVATPNGWTVWSVLGDLPHGLVHIYLFHQFDAPVTLNIADELARAREPGPLRDLFPPATLARVDRAYQRLVVARPAGCRAVGLIWLGLVVASLAAFLLLARPGRRAALVWLPIGAVLGPLGLLAWRLALGRTEEGGVEPGRPRAVVETAAGLAPAVVGIVLAFLIIVQTPAIGDSSLAQLLVDWGLPLGLGLIASQVPPLAAGGSDPARRRPPWAFVSANLAVAGVLAVTLPLIPLQARLCPIDGLAPLSWWALAALGAPLAGLPLYVYQRWAVRHGLSTWSVLWPGPSEREVPHPSWRRLPIWLAASLLALVAGIALGALLSTVLAGPG